MGKCFLGTSLEVSEGIRIGQREKLNFDALGPIPWTALVLDGPAELSQIEARFPKKLSPKGQVSYSQGTSH